MAQRVVLAYSGGLDTSVGIGWLKDATGKEVVARPSMLARAAKTWRSLDNVRLIAEPLNR